jgi:hypothetical protein
MAGSLPNPVKRVAALQHHAAVRIDLGPRRGFPFRAGHDPGRAVDERGDAAQGEQYGRCGTHCGRRHRSTMMNKLATIPFCGFWMVYIYFLLIPPVNNGRRNVDFMDASAVWVGDCTSRGDRAPEMKN